MKTGRPVQGIFADEKCSMPGIPKQIRLNRVDSGE
jgi:hypothetical protein